MWPPKSIHTTILIFTNQYALFHSKGLKGHYSTIISNIFFLFGELGGGGLITHFLVYFFGVGVEEWNLKKRFKVINFTNIQGGRGNCTVNYTGTQKLIITY